MASGICVTLDFTPHKKDSKTVEGLFTDLGCRCKRSNNREDLKKVLQDDVLSDDTVVVVFITGDFDVNEYLSIFDVRTGVLGTITDMPKILILHVWNKKLISENEIKETERRLLCKKNRLRILSQLRVEGPFLLFTDMNASPPSIKKLTINSEEITDFTPTNHLKVPTLIAFHHETGDIFVTDKNQRGVDGVYKFEKGDMSKRKLIDSDNIEVRSISLDQRTGILYLIGSNQSHGDGHIYCLERGRNKLTHVLSQNRLLNLAVDEENRYLYWTKDSPPAIERASIDDVANIETIVSSNLQGLHCIHIDNPGKNKRRLIWTKGSTVEAAELDGSSRITLTEIYDKPSLIGITTVGSSVFVADSARGIWKISEAASGGDKYDLKTLAPKSDYTPLGLFGSKGEDTHRSVHKSQFIESMNVIFRKFCSASTCEIRDLLTKVMRNVEIYEHKHSPWHKLVYQRISFKTELSKPIHFYKPTCSTIDTDLELPLYDDTYLSPGQYKKAEHLSTVMNTRFSMDVDNSAMDAYPIDNDPRGLCIIINIANNRTGSFIDEMKMYQLFKELLFKPRVITNKTHEEIGEEVKRIAGEIEHTDQCLFVILLAHGTREDKVHKFQDVEGSLEPSTYIWNAFKPPDFKNLQNKPKVLILQTCMGTKGMLPVIEKMDTDDGSTRGDVSASKSQLHKDSHMLTIAATLPEHLTYREPLKGTFLIQAIDHVFREHAAECDVQTLMTKTTKWVMEHVDVKGAKQHPHMDITMPNSLFLNPGYVVKPLPVVSNSTPNKSHEVKEMFIWQSSGSNEVLAVNRLDTDIKLVSFSPDAKTICKALTGPDMENVKSVLCGIAKNDEEHVIVILERDGRRKAWFVNIDKINKSWKFCWAHPAVDPISVCPINNDGFAVLTGATEPKTNKHASIEIYNFNKIKENECHSEKVIRVQHETLSPRDRIFYYNSYFYIIFANSSVVLLTHSKSHTDQRYIGHASVGGHCKTQPGNFFKPCAVRLDSEQNILIACFDKILTMRKTKEEFQTIQCEVEGNVHDMFFNGDTVVFAKPRGLNFPTFPRAPVINTNPHPLHIKTDPQIRSNGDSYLSPIKHSPIKKLASGKPFYAQCIWTTQEENTLAMGDAEATHIILVNSLGKQIQSFYFGLFGRINRGLFLAGNTHVIICDKGEKESNTALLVHIDPQNKTIKHHSGGGLIVTNGEPVSVFQVDKDSFAILCSPTDIFPTGFIEIRDRKTREHYHTVQLDGIKDLHINDTGCVDIDGYYISRHETCRINKYNFDGSLVKFIQIPELDDREDKGEETLPGMFAPADDEGVEREYKAIDYLSKTVLQIHNAEKTSTVKIWNSKWKKLWLHHLDNYSTTVQIQHDSCYIEKDYDIRWTNKTQMPSAVFVDAENTLHALLGNVLYRYDSEDWTRLTNEMCWDLCFAENDHIFCVYKDALLVYKIGDTFSNAEVPYKCKLDIEFEKRTSQSIIPVHNGPICVGKSILRYVYPDTLYPALSITSASYSRSIQLTDDAITCWPAGYRDCVIVGGGSKPTLTFVSPEGVKVTHTLSCGHSIRSGVYVKRWIYLVLIGYSGGPNGSSSKVHIVELDPGNKEPSEIPVDPVSTLEIENPVQLFPISKVLYGALCMSKTDQKWCNAKIHIVSLDSTILSKGTDLKTIQSRALWGRRALLHLDLPNPHPQDKVCVTTKGWYCILSCMLCEIRVYSKTGLYLYTVGELGLDPKNIMPGRFWFPLSIQCTGNGTLVVTEMNGIMHAYEMESNAADSMQRRVDWWEEDAGKIRKRVIYYDKVKRDTGYNDDEKWWGVVKTEQKEGDTWVEIRKPIVIDYTDDPMISKVVADFPMEDMEKRVTYFLDNPSEWRIIKGSRGSRGNAYFSILTESLQWVLSWGKDHSIHMYKING